MSKTTAVLRALVENAERFPVGMTRADIRKASNLAADAEITRPVRDLRKQPYGLHIICHEVSGTLFGTGVGRRWRYRIAAADLPRARKILESISPATPSAPESSQPTSKAAPGALVASAGSATHAPGERCETMAMCRDCAATGILANIDAATASLRAGVLAARRYGLDLTAEDACFNLEQP